MNIEVRTSAGSATAFLKGEVLRRLWPLLCLAVLVLAIGLLADLAPTVLQRRITQGLIYLVAVVGLYVFVGNSGVLSFGHVAFMAIGAYVSALLTMSVAAKGVFLPDLPIWLKSAEWAPLAAAFVGGAVAAVVALVVGFPLMRLSGISAGIATFAILVVTYVVIGNWSSVTGGQNSLMGLPIYVGPWTATAGSLSPSRSRGPRCSCGHLGKTRQPRRHPV